MLKRHLSPRAPIKLDSEKTQAFTPEQIEEARALLKDGIPGWDFHSMVLGAMELRSRNILSWGDGPLRLWSEDGAPVFTLEGHHGLVTGARQLRSGRILSWDTEGGLRLWTGEGVPIASLESHSWILGALGLSRRPHALLGGGWAYTTSSQRWHRPRGDGLPAGGRSAYS
jgi:hypothetical protein